MKVMKTNTKLRVPDCRNFKQCGRKAKSIWATLCRYCFLSQAVRCGARSSGNADAKGKTGNAGNADAKGKTGNAGNADAKGKTGNAGNADAKGKTGNAGNADAKGKAGNVGNPDAKGAGKRSGVRRSAKRGLIVKKKWLDLILAGQKEVGDPWQFDSKARLDSLRGEPGWRQVDGPRTPGRLLPCVAEVLHA